MNEQTEHPPTIPSWLQQLATLTPAEGYNLMGAVRGPDLDLQSLSDLKIKLTGRLRSVLFRITGCPGVMVPSPITSEEMKMVGFYLRDLAARLAHPSTPVSTNRSIVHFLTHTLWGIEATLQHPVWSGHGVMLAKLIRDTLDTVMEITY